MDRSADCQMLHTSQIGETSTAAKDHPMAKSRPAGALYLWLSSPWLHVFLLLSSPALLLLGNSDWLFDPVGYLDPWMYVGFFLHYDYPTILADEKKIARLPWILRGFAAYKLFGPIIASYVLHWCDLVAPAIALYFTLNRLFTRWIGFLVAGLILFFTPLFGPAGWDYHDSGDGFFLSGFVSCAVDSRQPAGKQRPPTFRGGSSLHNYDSYQYHLRQPRAAFDPAIFLRSGKL